MPLRGEARVEYDRQYQHDWYLKNKDRAKDKKRRQRKRLAGLVRHLRERPCADCRVEYPWYVMEFDHREKPIHRNRFGYLVGFGSERLIMAEVAKCDVVCANCHNARTYIRRQAAVAQQAEVLV